MKKRQFRLIYIYIFFIVAVFVVLFPIYWLFLVSIKSRRELFAGPTMFPSSIFLQNYIIPFIKGLYGKYLLNSIIISSGNTAIVIFLALFAAYALSRFKIYGSESIFFWLITNRMAPPAAFIISFYLIFSKLHLLDTRIGLILVYCLPNLPLAIWLLKGIIDAIPIELDEAALIDGCSRWRVVSHIIFPVAGAGVATTAILVWLFSWNELLFASILTGMKACPIPPGIVKFVTVVGTDWGEMAAVSVVCLIPPIVFLGLIQKYIVAGLTFGSIK